MIVGGYDQRNTSDQSPAHQALISNVSERDRAKDVEQFDDLLRNFINETSKYEGRFGKIRDQGKTPAVDLVEHRLQTGCPQVRPKYRFHVLHGFARIQTWDRVSISSEKPRRTNSSQGARAASESFVTTSPNCAAE